MRKILGIPFGPGESAFQIMQANNVNVDYTLSDRTRQTIGFTSAMEEFERMERDALANGKIRQYFKDNHDKPNFWGDYFNKNIALTAKPLFNSEVEELNYATQVDLKNYDTVAFSCYDEYFHPLKSALRYLDVNFNGNIVVGGQIVRESTIPTLRKLSDKLLLNRGSFDNFKKFTEGSYSPKGNVIENEPTFRIDSYDALIKSGLVCPDTGNLRGEDGLEIIFDDEKCSSFNVIGVSGCLNNCDYCYSPLTLKVPVSTWIESIDRFSGKAENAYVNILDNNPLQFLGPYKDIVSKAYEKFNGVILNTFIDPSVLSTSTDARSFVKSVVKNPKTGCVSFFVGRECADESGARSIGRKFKGNLRGQSALDAEKRTIEKLIEDLESAKKKTKNNYRLRLAYVLGPNGPEQLDGIKKEIEHFKSLGSGVKWQILPLDAYPGTECHSVYKKDLMSEFPGILVSNITSPNILEYEKTF